MHVMSTESEALGNDGQPFLGKWMQMDANGWRQDRTIQLAAQSHATHNLFRSSIFENIIEMIKI